MEPWFPRLRNVLLLGALAACVDQSFGPGSHAPSTVRVRVTMPAGTPDAWTPVGETLYVSLRRAGRVDPIVDSAFVVVDSLATTLTVPMAYAVERFVVTSEVRYGALLLFVGFEAAQLRADADTVLELALQYVGPGARAASFELGARDSTLLTQDTASLIRVVRDSAGAVIPNVPARYVAARPTLVGVDTGGVLTAVGEPTDTARVIAYLPTGLSGAVVVSVVSPVPPPPPPPPPPPQVTTIAVTPPTATLTSVGAQQQFSASASDQNGAPMSGVVFAWQTSNPLVATVDQNGLATATGAGDATISATADGVTGSATLSVAIAAQPVTKTWVGGDPAGPNDWARGANWNPAGVPSSGDSVVIDSTANNPLLTGAVSVVRVAIIGGNLTLNGQRLTVGGDFSTDSGKGTLTMTSAADTLRVLGNARFAGGSTDGLLTAGALFVAGSFEQRNSTDTDESFQARDAHRTIFNGSAQQQVIPEGQLEFGHLDIANNGGVRGFLETDVEVQGTFRIATAVEVNMFDVTLDLEDSVVTVAGSRLTGGRMHLEGVMAIAGAFDPGTVEFEGEGQRIQPGLAYNNVEIRDSVLLTGATTFAGFLHIIEDGNLVLNGQSLNAAALNVGGIDGGQGTLTMKSPADVLVVAGDALFDGEQVSDALTAGTLRVAGSFAVPRGRFVASGTHRTVLDGTAAQQLDLSADADFHDLEITNPVGPISFPAGDDAFSGFTATGKFAIRTAVVVNGAGARVDVTDSVVTVSGSSLSLGSLILRDRFRLQGTTAVVNFEFAGANQDIPSNIAYENVTVTGQARLVGPTALSDFAFIHGPQSNLTLNGHRLTVGGSFFVGSFDTEGGTLTMTNATDSLDVGDDFAMAGASTAGLLSAGTIVARGGFFADRDPLAYQPSGTHRTVLAGTALQRVSFANPGAATSRFNHLLLANTSGGMWMESPVFVAGTLVASSSQLVSGNGNHLLNVGGVDLKTVSFDRIPLTIGAGAIARFDSVTFSNQNPALTQLAIAHPGAGSPFTFTGTRFLTTPTTGLYVSATDIAPSDGNVLTINFVNSVPPNGSAFTATSGGAVVNWSGSFGPAFASLSAGFAHSCGLSPAGGMYCWGSNFDGQLGDGTTMQRNVPTPIPSEAPFLSVVAGGQHSCGIAYNNEAYCWGQNGSGQLGNGTQNNTTTFVAVTGGLTFASIAAGEQHTCALTTTGTAYCWGRNGSGEVGDGTTTDRFSPVAVAGGLTFTSISTKIGHTCALTSAGAAYCWGRNLSGQLGDGTTNNSSAPVLVSGGHVFATLSATAEHTCGVTTTGTTYCWGLNASGQLGDGTTTQRTTPTAVSGGLTFASVSPGGNGFTCARTTAGAAYCWGINNVGQLGDGTTTQRLTPTAVGGGLAFSTVESGFAHVIAIATGGSGYAWGGNTQGQLGDGTTTARSTPTLITPP
jgi:alpha-tubulin suppressor-like RCC1 family protein